MNFNEYWNKNYTSRYSSKIVYDNWLDSYKDIINNCKTKILDLGCGAGNDTLYLTERGYNVVACDYSEVALKKLNDNIKNVETKLIDISKTLPFECNSFDLIIADLSLHYFDTETTFKIMNEIKRVLKPNGHLLARVNSVLDVLHGAGKGEKIEDNFYFVDGYNKRFFTKEDAFKFFGVIGSINVKQAELLRYDKPKMVIKIIAQNKKQ